MRTMRPPKCDNCGRKRRGDGPLCAICQRVADAKAREQLNADISAAVHPRVVKAERAVEQEALVSERKLKFLTELLANGGHVQHACRAVQVSEMTMRRYAEDDPDFALAWETVQDTNIEKLESEADRRAVGYQKELTYKGEKTGHTITEYSDMLLMFRLKALRPEKYRDGPGVQKGAHLSEAELDEALGKMIARRAAKQGSATIIDAETVQ